MIFFNGWAKQCRESFSSSGLFKGFLDNFPKGKLNGGSRSDSTVTWNITNRVRMFVGVSENSIITGIYHDGKIFKNDADNIDVAIGINDALKEYNNYAKKISNNVGYKSDRKINKTIYKELTYNSNILSNPQDWSVIYEEVTDVIKEMYNKLIN